MGYRIDFSIVQSRVKTWVEELISSACMSWKPGCQHSPVLSELAVHSPFIQCPQTLWRVGYQHTCTLGCVHDDVKMILINMVS